VTIPPLYVEGLAQRALRGPDQLNVYKLGLIEAILKSACRAGAQDETTIRSAIQAALDVVRWEPRPPGDLGAETEGLA
jgi:hypothetical protein